MGTIVHHQMAAAFNFIIHLHLLADRQNMVIGAVNMYRTCGHMLIFPGDDLVHGPFQKVTVGIMEDRPEQLFFQRGFHPEKPKSNKICLLQKPRRYNPV